ncbi:MAG: hypothetical protein ACJ79R_13555 [Anaeromyxobacteraceae bacterium]
MPDWGSYTVALENSSAYVLDDTGTVMGASSLSRLPDLVVRWDKSFERGAVSVRAMTQELRVDDGNGHTAATRGWGAAASALYKTREAGDFVTAGITGGDGIGRYLNYIEGAPTTRRRTRCWPSARSASTPGTSSRRRAGSA